MSQAPVPKQSYQKPWLSWADQVAKLKARGIIIADESAAEAFLSHINYYRFSGYCLAFEQSRHQLVAGTTFEQIRQAYEFDCALRDLVTEALEYVEVDLRTTIAYRLGEQYGPFGHADPTSFHTKYFKHGQWLQRLQDESDRSSEIFVEHFKTKYIEYPNLPVWVVTEIMSFGTLSIMFKNLLRDDQRHIARRYGLQGVVLAAWMHHLVYIRNICAHHARLWDRVWSIKPTLPHGKDWQPPALPGNNRLFCTLLMLYQMKKRCDGISPAETEWRDKVIKLVCKPPPAPNPTALMGLPTGWDSHMLWT